MKIKGILFILATCIAHISAMKPEPEKNQHAEMLEEFAYWKARRAAAREIIEAARKKGEEVPIEQLRTEVTKLTPRKLEMMKREAEKEEREAHGIRELIKEDKFPIGQLMELEKCTVEIKKARKQGRGVSIADLIIINELPAIEYGTLDLSDLQINNIDALCLISNIESVKSLKLSNNHISTIKPDTFAKLDNLNYLKLDGNPIGSIAIGLPKNLRWLDLNNAQIRTISPHIIAGAGNTNIIVSLIGNPLTEDSKEALRKELGDSLII